MSAYFRLLKFTWPQKVVAHTCRQVMVNAITLHNIWTYSQQLEQSNKDWEGMQHFKRWAQSSPIEDRIMDLCEEVLEYAAQLRDRQVAPPQANDVAEAHDGAAVVIRDPPQRNVVSIWFSRADLNAIRLNSGLNHALENMPGTRRTCKLCAYHGRQSTCTKWCRICRVALCGMRKGCFDEFHSRRESEGDLS